MTANQDISQDMNRGKQPAVSVCIPLYRKEAFIAETIQSVLDQTFTNFELVVIDNDSPDRSAEIARSFDDPRITVLTNTTNVGPGENFSRVVSASTAPLVKLVCADDLIHPRCLEREVPVLERDPSLAIVTCRSNMIDDKGRIVARDANQLPLTDRECEVLGLVAGGLRGSAIAQHLILSPETIKSHVQNAMTKLGAHTRAHAVAIALSTGQIDMLAAGKADGALL